MSDAKLDPRSLTAEERAIVDQQVNLGTDEYAEAWLIAEPIIEARRALFAPTASEPEKVETDYSGYHFSSCEPAQPEPAAPEMPLPLQIAMDSLAGAASFARLEAQSDANYVVARTALESWWRTHAQPVANVAPKRLEKVPVREIGRAASALRLWKTQTDADVFGAKEDADEIDRWLKRLDAFERGGREGEGQ